VSVSRSIRHVHEEVRDALAAQAALEGRSLQEYLLQLVTRRAEQPTMAQLLKRVSVRRGGSEMRVTREDVLEEDEDLR
jgi:antitoxin FitA